MYEDFSFYQLKGCMENHLMVTLDLMSNSSCNLLGRTHLTIYQMSLGVFSQHPFSYRKPVNYNVLLLKTWNWIDIYAICASGLLLRNVFYSLLDLQKILEARSKHRSIHAPNLTDELSTANNIKFGRVCCTMRHWCGDWFIRHFCHVPNLMHR